jgi:hypothetical protein
MGALDQSVRTDQETKHEVDQKPHDFSTMVVLVNPDPTARLALQVGDKVWKLDGFERQPIDGVIYRVDRILKDGVDVQVSWWVGNFFYLVPELQAYDDLVPLSVEELNSFKGTLSEQQLETFNQMPPEE